MDEQYEVGQLYRAISSTELVEVQFNPVEGLKLTVKPEGVKVLRNIQKKLRDTFREKIPFAVILNTMLSVPDWNTHIDAITAIIAEQRRAAKEAQPAVDNIPG